MIFFPTAILPSAVSGMPSSSRQSPTTTPPYFATSGKICSITSFLPLTELIRGFPLYTRRPRSIASALEVSNCNGRSMTACSSFTTSSIMEGSSISGRPTFTSRTSAPLSCWVTPSRRIYSRLLSRRACLNLDFPVGLIRSPMIMVFLSNTTAWE